ncbi:hypothetical protein MASR1M59_23440 [Melaminivora sp.]
MQQLTPQRQQRGITIIESLVALVVAALGIMGVLGMQMRTLTDTQTSVRRAQAIRLIEDLGERMKANPNALANLNAYVSDFSSDPSPGDCTTNACSNAALATYDMAIWKKNVKSSLPLGQAQIFIAPGEADAEAGVRRQLGIMISWRENEKDNSADPNNNFKDYIDSTKSIASDGTVTSASGTAATCPTGRSCHLQYLPVIARCAPYFGDSTIQYFCAGA